MPHSCLSPGLKSAFIKRPDLDSGVHSGVIPVVVPLPSGLLRCELGGHAPFECWAPPKVPWSCFLQTLLTWYYLHFLLSWFSSSGHTLIKFLPKMWCPDLNMMLQIHSTHWGIEGDRCFLYSESFVSVPTAEFAGEFGSQVSQFTPVNVKYAAAPKVLFVYSKFFYSSRSPSFWDSESIL